MSPVDSIIVKETCNQNLQRYTNVSFKSKSKSNLERTPEQDTIEKKGMSTGGKIAIGSVATLGVVALIDQFAFKGKYRKRIFDMFKKSKVEDIVTKKGLTYKDGNLYTGDVIKTSKGGNQLKTTYKEGVVVSREYIPADKTKIQKIEKTYDNETHEGLKLVKGKITEADGTVKYTTQGYFTEHSFAPEIESKIKMREFDELKIGDYKPGKYDFGDGVELEVDNESYYLYKNGERIRNKNIFEDGDFVISASKADIYRTSDNKFGFCAAKDKLGNTTVYYDDGVHYTQKWYDDSGKFLSKPTTEYYDALGNRKYDP